MFIDKSKEVYILVKTISIKEEISVVEDKIEFKDHLTLIIQMTEEEVKISLILE